MPRKRFILTEKAKIYLSVCLAVLLLSVAFFVRASNLEGKFYWIDEVSSSFVITGHWPEYIDAESGKSSGKIITVGKFLRILEENPKRDSKQLVSTLMTRDPQHSPLYFTLVQQWAGLFGASPKSLRMASSVLTFFGIPIFALLCLELFGSFVFSLVGLGTLALAPFHILFSQQNREYGFWFTTCTLTTALLLIAHRKNERLYWVAYGVSVAVSLYTFLFSLPFLFSHLLFQLHARKSGESRRFKNFIWSAGLGILAYLPWMANILLNRQQVEELNSWSSVYLEPKLYLQGIILNFSRLFLDFNLPSFRPLPTQEPLIMSLIMFVLAAIFVGFVISLRRLSASKGVLLSSMFLSPFLFLFSMDIWKGQGIHALVGRQLMPAWMSVYLAVVFVIGTGLQSKIAFKRLLAFGCTLALATFGTMFAVSYIPANHWWPIKPKALFDEASIITKSNADLLVTLQPTETKQFISLSYSLRPELPLLMLKDQQHLPAIDYVKTVALYHPSIWLLEFFKTNFELKKVGDSLWIGQRIGN